MATAVTQFTLDELHSRTPMALYVDGVKQHSPIVSDDERVNSFSARGRT